MVANVESMFSAREVPWHGIGEIVDRCLTAREALIAGGLDWEVGLFPIQALVDEIKEIRVNDVTKEPEEVRVTLPTPQLIEVPDRYAVIRDSDQEVFEIVGARYVPVQNWKSFEFFDQVVADGSAKYETAGALDGGRKVFLTAKIPRELKIAGEDAYDLYLVMANSHDGSLAFRAMVTPVRVVCQNTLNLAIRGAKQSWSMRHTESIDGKIEEARKSLDLTFAYVDEFEQEMERLVAADFSKRQFESIVKDVFPGKANDDGRFTDEQYALIGVLESSPTIADGIRYTKYGALQAVREYDDWGRDYRTSKSKSLAEQRTQATWFGTNVTRSNQLLKALQSA